MKRYDIQRIYDFLDRNPKFNRKPFLISHDEEFKEKTFKIKMPKSLKLGDGYFIVTRSNMMDANFEDFIDSTFWYSFEYKGKEYKHTLKNVPAILSALKKIK